MTEELSEIKRLERFAGVIQAAMDNLGYSVEKVADFMNLEVDFVEGLLHAEIPLDLIKDNHFLRPLAVTLEVSLESLQKPLFSS